MSAWATIGQFVVFSATLAAAVYAVAKLTDAACHWAAGWKARAEVKRSDLAHAQSNVDHFRACWESVSKERYQLSAERAEYARSCQRMTLELEDAAEELAAKQRRLRGVLRQARAWRGVAIGRGYSRAEWLREVSEWKAARYARKVQRVAAAKVQSAPRSGR